MDKTDSEANLERVVIIMRSPCLPEDEGRHFFERRCTYQEAKAWIAAQKGEYFGPSDYYIAEQYDEED